MTTPAVATVLGDLADGRVVSDDERAVARRAIDDGWFVSVHVAHLDHLDTEELFFQCGPDLDLADEATAFTHGVVPLAVLWDRAAWERAAERWLRGDHPEHGRAQWDAFVERVARPLAAALGLELGPR